MTAPRRRPRSANSLKDLGRLLNAADTAHEVGRAARLSALASEINDTEAFLEKLGRAVEAMDLLFQAFGVRAIVCGSRLHIYEEWPGMDRRWVSGSVWDGRPPLSTVLGRVAFAAPTRIGRAHKRNVPNIIPRSIIVLQSLDDSNSVL
jgi:hypothetical protein